MKNREEEKETLLLLLLLLRRSKQGIQIELKQNVSATEWCRKGNTQELWTHRMQSKSPLTLTTTLQSQVRSMVFFKSQYLSYAGDAQYAPHS